MICTQCLLVARYQANEAPGHDIDGHVSTNKELPCNEHIPVDTAQLTHPANGLYAQTQRLGGWEAARKAWWRTSDCPSPSSEDPCLEFPFEGSMPNPDADGMKFLILELSSNNDDRLTKR